LSDFFIPKQKGKGRRQITGRKLGIFIREKRRDYERSGRKREASGTYDQDWRKEFGRERRMATNRSTLHWEGREEKGGEKLSIVHR